MAMLSTTETMPAMTDGHALPQTHRAHLIRSTRKLGALLGETPQIIESTTPRHAPSASMSSIDSRRSGRIFETNTPPRSSSLAPSPTPFASRPMLYLKLASPARPLSVSVTSPLTPGFSPLTPTFAPVVVDRRKKMAKLGHLLGQNVPPELVFSAPPPSSPSSLPQARKSTRRGMPSPVAPSSALSVLMAREAQASPSSSSYAPPTSSASYVVPGSPSYAPPSPTGSLASPTREASAISYRSASAMDYRRASAIWSYTSPPSPTRTTSDEDEWVDVSAPISASYPPSPHSPYYAKPPSDADARAPTTPLGHESTTSRSTADARFLSRHFVFAPPHAAYAAPYSRAANGSTDGFDYTAYHVHEAAAASTHRSEREQGWSGEWSGAQGMEDVVRALRDLRVK